MSIKKTVAFLTLGCKVNSYETEAMQQIFINEGYELVEFGQISDIYVVNTCTVTNIADRKSRQMLHKAKKLSPDSIVVAVGCYAQGAKEVLEKDKSIDVVIGNSRKKDIINIIYEYQLNKRQIELSDISMENNYEELAIETMTDKTRAYIKIQDGCNQFCSYCIIPYVRGRVRSRSREDIYNEVKRLTLWGYKEIVLTGINLSSYGTDFKESHNGKGEELIEIIEEISKIDNLKRIRLGSLEPTLITDEFARNISYNKKICPHFHLSLQSGCDSVLKRMNRRYTTGEYYDKCKILSKYFENPALTTDIIVGFPGETDEEFNRTYNFLKTVSFSSMHIFQYSKRTGTKAALMIDQVDKRIMKERSNILIELEKKLRYGYIQSFIGKEDDILVEEKIKIDKKSYWTGHNERYVKMLLESEEDYSNKIVKGKAVKVIKEDLLLIKFIK